MAQSVSAKGIVYLVGAGPGDPDLVTLRAVDCLRRADLIIADYLVSQVVLERHAPPTVELIVRPERRGGLDQAEINRLLVEAGRAGRTVVRLKGGDPFIFGRGGEEAEALSLAGVAFEVIPGVTAALGAAAYAGIPLTHRGLSGSVTLVTGHEAEDKDGGAVDWEALGKSAGTVVFYMSSNHLAALTSRLIAAGRPPTTPVAVIERGTTARQRTLVATLADVADRARTAGLSPPSLTIVGDVVSLRERLAWFDRRPLRGRRILLLSTEPEAGHVRPDGAEVVNVRSLLVLPLREKIKQALPRLAIAKTLVLSSKHAVDALFAALDDVGWDGRALAGKRIATVGRATADRLLGRGIRADLVGDAGGEELAELLRRHVVEGPIFYLRAAVGRPELPARLSAAGFEAEVITAYETAADVPALERAVRRHQVEPFDAIGFASPKGVESFVATSGGAETLGGVLVGAIGATTASALAGLGLNAVTAPTPDLGALEQRLADGLAEALGIG